MSTKNLLNNLKNNHRLIIVVILLIILVVLAHRYQREHFQEVNINSIAKAGSVGKEGSPGKDGAAGDSALNVLQKLEAPSDADEKVLYDAVFQHGSNATPEGDSAVNILKGLVDHITQKVTRNIGSGLPDYTIIPFHINKSASVSREVFEAYLDSEGEDKTNKAGPILIGGFGTDYDSEELLPSGFQVCNGANLQRINAQGEIVNDTEREKTPDFRGRFLMGGGRGISNQTNIHEGDGGDSAGYTAENFYYQDQTGGKVQVELAERQMPRHRHMSLMRDPGRCDFDSTANEAGQKSWTHCPKFGEQRTDGTVEIYDNVMVRGWIEETVATDTRVAKGYYSDTNTALGYATWRNTRYTGGPRAAGRGEDCEVNKGYLYDRDSPDCEADGEAHTNMPPYKPVLYLIKIKDER